VGRLDRVWLWLSEGWIRTCLCRCARQTTIPEPAGGEGEVSCGWFGGDEVRRSKRWYGYGYGGGYLARWYDAAGGDAVVVLPWGQLGTTWEGETLLYYWTSSTTQVSSRVLKVRCKEDALRKKN
jgi:hypothetical protein